ncbi:MAG: dihydropteroate synthase, partial [Deltaproteobacteria bacterium]|nr:dihydropteroate synthase [Deltaproteobacteria bacterium]
KTLGPVMVGPSRKRFIGELTGVSNAAERDFGTVGAVLKAVQQGAAWVRVHNVEGVVQALKVLRHSHPGEGQGLVSNGEMLASASMTTVFNVADSPAAHNNVHEEQIGLQR